MKESEEMAAERREEEKRLLDRSARSGEEINRRNSEAEGREAAAFARRSVEMAVCMKCGAEEHDVPLAETGTGTRLLKKCDACGGQLVSNPRRG